ncbi:MAG TPA: M20/M25/M40 family metallo-hydrolase [Kiritimatiellia bacterium]|nr:M20/M25/M40 family metallo-hydrolase [Kiritimatiellia bacterium]HMO97912.1 M20/M25/M40 family metallo-hydrolase [Kiritimatiellia bacterium]HMP95569.1 M20/M25/M40 family metallo-hydrolase [Kiritimatiellia bacterium]
MKKKKNAPWMHPMSDRQFNWMREILAAPSPIGIEAAMSYGVIKPAIERFMPKSWAIHQFKGNAGLVVDTHPGDDKRTSVMLIGHADKIRMQVRSIGEDGKVWINSDSFLPCTLIGHDVLIFSEDPKHHGRYNVLEGGTVEAIGAIHFAPPDLRSGAKGIKPEMLYVELQAHGENAKKELLKSGIKQGDTIILNRPIRRGFSPDTFYGAYLDNGLGCFIVTELARLIAEAGKLNNLRVLFAIATYEEIGRFGSRVLAGEFKPDVLIGVDVDHDYKAAPGVGDQRYTPIAIGQGFSMATGAVTSEYVNSLIEKACRKQDIPLQRSPTGRDTGTDAMAAVLASIDAAAVSVGIPTRNMHTISEVAHTGDVLACLHGMKEALMLLDQMNGGKGLSRKDLRDNHPRLDQAVRLGA